MPDTNRMAGTVAAVGAWGTGIALAGLWIWRLAAGWADPVSARVAGLAMVPIGLVALATIFLATADPRIDPRARRAWRRLCLALVSWWVAAALWDLSGRAPVSWSDPFNLMFFPLVLAGVFGFPATPLDREARLRFVLDTGVVLLSGVAGVWYFVLWPSLSRGLGDPTDVLVNAIYPVADLVLLFAACAALFRQADAASRRALVWVSVALIGRFCGDLVFGWETVVGSYQPGGPSDLTWMIAAWGMAAGAVSQRRGARAAASAQAPRPGFAEWHGVNVLPYASVGAVYVFLLATASAAWGPRVGGVLLSAVAVTGLVLARQFLATRENLRLQSDRAARDAAREVEARFRSLVQHASDVIVVVDPHARILFASPSIARVLGHPAEGIVDGSFVDLVHPDDQARVRAAIAYAGAPTASSGLLELRLRRADGAWRTVEALSANLVDDPNVGGIVVTARDVTERAALQAELAHQAFHDPLTGLANRALFRDRVEQALARKTRRGDGSVAVLFLDLDDFKTVNDSLGHAAGDRLLVAVAERLRAATRGCDTVARLGGDEFAVLLENPDDTGTAAVAERIAEVLAVPVALDGTAVGAGASIGIAPARPEDGTEELLRNADVAMYRAKQQGKGGYAVFAPEMHAALLDRIELEADLRRALADPDCSEFRILYQPIVDLADGRTAGLEALVRWQHPRRGLVSPAAFIPVAEATGLIVPLGDWVLRQACAQAAQWRALTRDDGGPALTITVNISGRQLQHPSLVDSVARALAGSALHPAALVLEITESVIMQDTEANLATLHALKGLGIRLAIDDFGTGYSSLSYLQRFPVDILKIDKAFVDGIARGGSDAALARTIVALGTMLSLRCIAEGVEDDEQRRHLRAIGCEYGQGYHFARPLTAEAAEERLAARGSVVAPAAAA